MTDSLSDMVAENTCTITFIGMSNTGKSTLAKRLEAGVGFSRYSVDDHIEQELKLPNIEASAEWLGYPGSENYKAHAPTYLDLEEKYTIEAAQTRHTCNTIIDTTGSVVHLAPRVGELLRERSTILHLKASEETIAAAIENYFAVPKPVIWGEYFVQRSDEMTEAALRRSYPALLRARLERYERLAHITIEANIVFSLSSTELLALLNDRCKELWNS